MDEAETIKIADVENGYYEQANKILSIVKTVAFFAINNVMCSRASNLYEKGEHDKIKSYLDKTLHLTLNLSIGSMVGLILVSPVFVPLYFGKGYDKTIYLLYIMSSLVPIICLSFTLGSIYYVPFGKRKESSYYLIIGSIINIILNIPLIIFFKSIGAAIASIVAELVISILFICKSNKFLTFKELFLNLWKKILAGGIMLGFVFGIRYLYEYFIEPSLLFNILEIAIIVLSGILIYELVLIITKDNSINVVKGIISSIFKRNKQSNNELDIK